MPPPCFHPEGGAEISVCWNDAVVLDVSQGRFPSVLVGAAEGGGEWRGSWRHHHMNATSDPAAVTPIFNSKPDGDEQACDQKADQRDTDEFLPPPANPLCGKPHLFRFGYRSGRN